jgi:hypothetical protein
MPKKRSTTYHKILKEFTKINDKLPEERKLSIQERRRIIKEKILPRYKGKPKSKFKITKVKSVILREVGKVPPKEICNLNYLDLSTFAFVEWFALDETINQIVPDCVYIKVTAGDYGETGIFNTRNYQYGRNGVRRIIENIRPDAENESGRFIFTGIKKLRPRKANNGDAENYYLDFVLNILDNRGNSDPQGDVEEIEFIVPKSRKITRKRAKIKNVIEDRIKSLKKQRDKKRRAKKTLQKNVTKFVKSSQKVQKLKKKAPVAVTRDKQFRHTAKLLDKYLADGVITQYQYDKSLQRMLKEYTD